MENVRTRMCPFHAEIAALYPKMTQYQFNDTFPLSFPNMLPHSISPSLDLAVAHLLSLSLSHPFFLPSGTGSVCSSLCRVSLIFSSSLGVASIVCACVLVSENTHTSGIQHEWQMICSHNFLLLLTFLFPLFRQFIRSWPHLLHRFPFHNPMCAQLNLCLVNAVSISTIHILDLIATVYIRGWGRLLFVCACLVWSVWRVAGESSQSWFRKRFSLLWPVHPVGVCAS